MILKKIKKFKKTSIILAVFFLFLAAVAVLSQGKVYSKQETEYGITFSQVKARQLNLDWRRAYMDILSELDIKKLRLAAYWDEIEKEKGKRDYKDLDWMIEKASERDVDIILAVGERVPRWPECHFPGWGMEIKKEERQENLLNHIEKTIKRYKDNPNIKAWQVENEPFLSSHFGECPPLDKEFLDRELELVRKLDSRPVVVTDSGELSLWAPAARRADIFGTTMYKQTYSEALGSYVEYPIRPGFFHFKRNVADWFAEPEEWIVIELQGEPWGPAPYQDLSLEERKKTMNPEKFNKMIEFARQSGFKEFYLWGAEYWYWEKVKNNNPEMWQEAKKLFTQ